MFTTSNNSYYDTDILFYMTASFFRTGQSQFYGTMYAQVDGSAVTGGTISANANTYTSNHSGYKVQVAKNVQARFHLTTAFSQPETNAGLTYGAFSGIMFEVRRL